MTSAVVLAPQDPPRTVRHRQPRWYDHTVARLLAPRIDRDLAKGSPSWSTVARAARAVQLTGRRRRDSVARSLELLVERAEQPPARGRSTAIPPCRDQVRHALSEIMDIASRLRSAEPVDAHGLAMLRALLGDGGGPCYVRSQPAALTQALQEVSRCLRAAT